MSPTPKRRNSQRTKNVKTSRGLVRIIAGTHRGRRLPVLVHEGLRPTGDRVKETLFNWLMSALNQAQCLDMFAGSGSLGIEALSRGATHTVFIEYDKTVATQITQNLLTLGELDNATVHHSNALTHDFSSHAAKQFSLVFIDPPFANDMVNKSINKLLTDDLLLDQAFIYIETGHSDSYQLPTQFVQIKELKTSQVNARLFQFNAT
jgi:16S rRNA (guanine966-N2)-methyltransferase